MDLLNINKKVILASQSPRRKELLSALGIQFEIKVSSYEEVLPTHLSPEQIPLFHANNKAMDVLKNNPDAIIISADTVVILNNELLEKPKDLDDAKQMLSKLSGQKHQVLTAICVQSNMNHVVAEDSSYVEIAPLTQNEIDYYVNNHNVMDKAGSYGIQDWFGLAKNVSITGSYFNIMGLPTHLIYQILKENKF